MLLTTKKYGVPLWACLTWLVFYYEGNIALNLYGRYDGITRKSTVGCIIAEGDFLIMQEIVISAFSWGGRKVGFWISIFAGYLENIKNSLTRWENSGSIKKFAAENAFLSTAEKTGLKKLEKRYWQCLNDMLIYKSSLEKTLLRWTMNIENSIVQKFCKCTTFSIL